MLAAHYIDNVRKNAKTTMFLYAFHFLLEITKFVTPVFEIVKLNNTSFMFFSNCNYVRIE